MSCQKLRRQSLHMVLSLQRGLYSLSHMDVSRLFYPSRAEAVAAEAKAKGKENGRNMLATMEKLPDPSIYYKPFRSDVSYPGMSSLFGESNNHILCSDAAGYTGIYNAERHSFLGMPVMNSPKGPKRVVVSSIPRTAAHARSDFALSPDLDSNFFTGNRHGEHIDCLYVMDMDPDTSCRCSFEVLAYYPRRAWRWRSLPPPPFLGNPEYKPPDNIRFTVVDGTRICVSSGTSTYSFDTVAREWSKVGEWVLPFHGKAEYIPELRLWLGLLARTPYNLCAFDLSGVAMGSCDAPPTLVQGFELDVDPPECCSLKDLALVNLGSCRFCIARFFDVHCDHGEAQIQIVVLTGVEVALCEDDQEERRFSMIKHKSERLPSHCIECVL